MSHRENLLRIKAVYSALGELADNVVFVGGATVSLYIDRLAEEVRPTDDVDILIELISYKGYAAVEEKLREKGFVNDWESGVICRYKIQGIVVDVMPTSDEILGFSNQWYTLGFANAINYVLDDESVIRILAPEYFLATKLEAFKHRGKGDGRTSTDFEDIVYFLNNRSGIWQEINDTQQALKDYLIYSFRELLSNKYIDEWVSVHLEYAEQERQYFILGSMRNFVDLNG
ncbi:MAG: nucleotidyl transferase AbiEii/AbiGii toxin family protein [Pedobacter sp.]|jgi:predicted nucleotidyltransferase